jgi:DNA-binding transcriptional LysR family regulator
MRKLNFDLDALRSFAIGVELGSFARAAERVGRSASAVSAQLRKLEEQAGTALVQKTGRTLALTAAGETLLSYARRMLSLNDEAVLAIGGKELAGTVRLGLQEDFSDRLLPEVLGQFARSHRGVQIEVRVGRNAELLEGVRSGRLDLALAWYTEADGDKASPHMSVLGHYPLHWIGSADAGPVRLEPGLPLPLVSFEAPCRLRAAATDALDAAGLPWRLVYSSPSLSGVWAAVAAGLGLTVRTRFGLPSTLALLEAEVHGLPPLPPIGLALHRAQERLPDAAARLHALIREWVDGLRPAPAAPCPPAQPARPVRRHPSPA